MSNPSDAVGVRLRRALGIGADAPGGTEEAAIRREREDAALAAWTAAVDDCDRAARERHRATRRATAAIQRAMSPLDPSYYQRIEACIAAEDWAALARFDGRRVARVATTRAMVDAARAHLDDATARTNAALESARLVRSLTTESLISMLGLDRAATVTGLSRRRLAALRAGR